MKFYNYTKYTSMHDIFNFYCFFFSLSVNVLKCAQTRSLGKPRKNVMLPKELVVERESDRNDLQIDH
jgi:hypothetical protein